MAYLTFRLDFKSTKSNVTIDNLYGALHNDAAFYEAVEKCDLEVLSKYILSGWKRTLNSVSKCLAGYSSGNTAP